MEPTANAFPGAACYSVRAARRKRNRTRKTWRSKRRKRITEKKDQEGEEEEKRKDPRLPGASLEARIYTVDAVAAVEHIAKATPTQRMNGRQTSPRTHVSTYVRK